MKPAASLDQYDSMISIIIDESNRNLIMWDRWSV